MSHPWCSCDRAQSTDRQLSPYCLYCVLQFSLSLSLLCLLGLSLGADISRERTRDQERSRSTCAVAGEQANERRSESAPKKERREPKNHALIRSLVSPNRLYATNPLLLSPLLSCCCLLVAPSRSLCVLACACAVSRSLSLSRSRSLSGGFDCCSHSAPWAPLYQLASSLPRVPFVCPSAPRTSESACIVIIVIAAIILRVCVVHHTVEARSVTTARLLSLQPLSVSYLSSLDHCHHGRAT